MRLKDKVAIITAAGSGTGRAGALLFSQEGARVVIADIDPKGGAETVKMIKNSGGDAIFVQIDAGKVKDIRRLIDTTIDSYGAINILWNHAGVPGPGVIFEEIDEEGFDMLLAVNMKGGFFATQFAVPYMKKAGGGSIIFTSSGAALKAGMYSPAYSLTKGGLVSLTFSLAAYLGPYNI